MCLKMSYLSNDVARFIKKCYANLENNVCDLFDFQLGRYVSYEQFMNDECE